MLTRKQKQAYDAIGNYIDRNGICPSYDEIADMIGLRSKSGVSRLIMALEQRGALRRIPACARAIQLVPLADVVLGD